MADKVAIGRADHDAGMRASIAVERNEMPAVQRQDCASGGNRVIENGLVRNGQADWFASCDVTTQIVCTEPGVGRPTQNRGLRLVVNGQTHQPSDLAGVYAHMPAATQRSSIPFPAPAADLQIQRTAEKTTCRRPARRATAAAGCRRVLCTSGISPWRFSWRPCRRFSASPAIPR
jgi:hypothetical protein